MPRPRGARNRIIGIEDRGGKGRRRFRVRALVDAEPISRGFATRGQAEAWARKLVDSFAGCPNDSPPIRDLIARWYASLEHPYPYHRHWVTRALEPLLEGTAEELEGPALVEAYNTLAAGLSGASNRCVLTCLRMFCGWLVEQRYLTSNPARDIKARGRVRKGKTQIETRRELLAFRDVVWERARAGDRGYLGVLLGLYLGLGSIEVRALEARHVDVDRLLMVPGKKTVNRRRVLPVVVPELWELLEAAARTPGRLVPLGWQALGRRVKLAAEAAGVVNASSLTFHSLRGMAASLGARNGAMLEAIASGLGHGGTRVTRDHYVSGQAALVADQLRALDTLRTPQPFPSQTEIKDSE